VHSEELALKGAMDLS